MHARPDVCLVAKLAVQLSLSLSLSSGMLFSGRAAASLYRVQQPKVDWLIRGCALFRLKAGDPKADCPIGRVHEAILECVQSAHTAPGHCGAAGTMCTMCGPRRTHIPEGTHCAGG